MKSETAEGGKPSEAPVTLILETNPYRAALIEFCKTKGKGEISLTATKSEKCYPSSAQAPRVAFSEMTSKEYRDEDQRIDAMRKGEFAIGDAELARIFNVWPSSPPKANDLPPEELPNVDSPSSKLKDLNDSPKLQFPPRGIIDVKNLPNGQVPSANHYQKMPKGADKQSSGGAMERILVSPREVLP
jgi:hypothetical protein